MSSTTGFVEDMRKICVNIFSLSMFTLLVDLPNILLNTFSVNTLHTYLGALLTVMLSIFSLVVLHYHAYSTSKAEVV